MTGARVVVRAPAKVNLTLAVLGKRPDGFHEVDTVLLALTLADRLTVRLRPRPGLTLRVHGPAAAGVPLDGTNLVLRAAERVLARVPGAPGLEFELEKHVPVGGGLGGGSADAAAALLAVATLLELDPAGPGLLSELAELGSDCAFFLTARASGLARCTGRGERVEPWPRPELPWWLVLVAPTFGCATARVYASHRGGAPRATELRAGELEGLAPAALEARLHNDLLPAALASHPELQAFQGLLEELEGGRFHLSGSGSSWFALCPDERAARTLAARLTAAAEGRRCALRGPWLARPAGAGVVREA